EPLESTGIFFIQNSVEELVNHLPAGGYDEESVRSYNRVVGECIDGVRDFLVLHYSASDRMDTEFWRTTKTLKTSDDLAERLNLWKKRLPNARTINSNFHGFEAYSYSVMLLGLNYHPETSLPALDHIPAAGAERAFRMMREKTERLVSTLPSQVEYLSRVRAEAGVPVVI
ncbi:MAG TPA: tryptophan 7-halogenase, partial [Thermoanaerobaculia bacterium]|nr:tryptophan 7-halogenase [Thermoanaerobaculia bacterium]